MFQIDCLRNGIKTANFTWTLCLVSAVSQATLKGLQAYSPGLAQQRLPWVGRPSDLNPVGVEAKEKLRDVVKTKEKINPCFTSASTAARKA